jgi:transcriptional regulator with GAF, ATPase, and Fis domain
MLSAKVLIVDEDSRNRCYVRTLLASRAYEVHEAGACREEEFRASRPDANAVQARQRHPWPGNIRDLHNVLERAVSRSDGKLNRFADLRCDAQSRGDSGIGGTGAPRRARSPRALGNAARHPAQGVLPEDKRTRDQPILEPRGRMRPPLRPPMRNSRIGARCQALTRRRLAAHARRGRGNAPGAGPVRKRR